MISIFKKIFLLLDQAEKRQFWLLTGAMIVVALVEVTGISSVLILLNVLADPSTIDQNGILSALRETVAAESEIGFLVILSALVLIVVVGGLILKAVALYAMLRFSYMRTYTISARLLAAYLAQPYAWFLQRNSAEIGKNVLQEVDGLVQRIVAPLIRLMGNTILVIAVIIFLLLVDPAVTLLSSLLMGVSYAVIYLSVRGILHRAGEEMLNALTERYRVAQEAMGGIKDVKLMGLEQTYTSAFGLAAQRGAKSLIKVSITSELPRYVLEAITFGALLSLVLVLLLRSDGDIAGVIPTLGIFAFSVLRLLPAIQQIYHGLASIRSGTKMLETLIADYHQVSHVQTGGPQSSTRLPLEQGIDLAHVSFRYPAADRPSLNELSLSIPARTTIGLVGGTGAGKTTLVDLILGLLTPDTGEIRVDGTPITKSNMRAWQNAVGYVPQAIFLIDDSIAANIAFGVPRDKIDMVAVERAARAAALHDFVTTELPEGYETKVGERGIRLSGGQRQRIGIARALYRMPSLLIMDEATSALDNITERIVMEAVQNIRADTTIILIAHRLTTVRECDEIFLLEKGKVVASGTYDELVANNRVFRDMATGT